MPYEVYKVIHISAIILVFMALAGAGYAQLQKPTEKKFPGKKWISITHGVGLLLVLVGGFGLAARTNAPLTSTWVLGKLAIWVVLGGIIALINKKPSFASKGILTVFILAVIAVILAVYKI